MTSLGFENYAEALKIYLSKYREVRKLHHGPCQAVFPFPFEAGSLTKRCSNLNQIEEKTKTGRAAKATVPQVVLTRALVPSQEPISREKAQIPLRTVSTAPRQGTMVLPVTTKGKQDTSNQS
jgi:hypothetical protein